MREQSDSCRSEFKTTALTDGCDELGFRLEDELNRSIGKMREEEASGLSSASPPSAQEEEPEKEVINVHVEKLISECCLASEENVLSL